MPSFLVQLILVTHVIPHGYPVSIILFPNEVHSGQALLFCFKN